MIKIIAVIPARYNSSRFPGKPLADINGRPMIWWVYNQVKKVKKVDKVVVATDDKKILTVCNELEMNCIITSKYCDTSTDRVFEVSKKIKSDLYIVVNGDEPIIDPQIIESIIPKDNYEKSFYVSNLMTEITNPIEVVDCTNIKVVVDSENNALFMSRSPIPYPKSNMSYKYYKHIGVLIYDLNALKFFSKTKKGYNELIEDINELRFIENGKKLKMIEVSSKNLSVDTPKDLEYVKEYIIKNNII